MAEDYGLPNDTVAAANPKLITVCDVPCPSCECDKTCGVYLLVLNIKDGLEGTLSDGHFRGCPACDWSSAMWVVPLTSPFTKEDYAKLN